MRIAVLGAAGAMAQVVVRDLLEFVPDVAITAADRKPYSHPDARVRRASLDARDEAATARLLDGHDAVLNCVTYYFNVPIMRAALAARVPYSDLGGLYHGSLEQFGLHEEFVRAGVPALLGMGSTPGITNVMAGVLARGLESVEAIHVRVGCLDRGVSGPLPVPYALDTVIDEFSLEPMIFRDGRPEAVPPMSGRETIDFPPPVGRAEALYTLHSEVAMFPRSFPGLRHASFKVAFEPSFVEKMRLLVELGFASREKIAGKLSAREVLLELAARQAVPPGGPDDCDALRVDLTGRKDGRPVERRADLTVLPHTVWKVAAGSLDTGVPLSIAGQLLASRTIRTPGVLCPETAVPGELFFEMLERREMRVRWS
ncbi:MAG TPA: saccharopine dehydrogenase NADP-binding domain-containing protein [Thermoanaerobaculia bacterium]|jgi:lysine 6-dehydrogenase|nr:saccharopine dehydrogenase NADP-binding domain-containing protein [Thermoanaerobaculia bacterium]